jgi:dienelactone hydrolase
MRLDRFACLLLFVLLTGSANAQAPKPGAKRPISDSDRAKIQAGIESLDKALAPPAGRTFGETVSPADAIADASVALKAAKWILRHGEFYAEDSVAKTLRTIDLGLERSQQLTDGKHPWTSAKGGVARGFVSRIDGSVQPYAVYVPASYDGVTPLRLDVILHGRDATLTEVKFLLAHEGKPYPTDETGLLLHVFVRGNNAYRWAGETDVLEAIEAVKRNYRVDYERVLLRGFSMGGAGAWHLGLHRPWDWCAVEAGAGFTETRSYANVKDLPDYQAKTLHIYDSVDYAQNASGVPITGYGGEDDPQKQAAQNIVDALTAQGVKMTTEGLVTKAEGLDFLRVLGAKMGHSIDPASAKVLKSFRDEHAAKGQNTKPYSIKFVTYTLKYGEAEWISIEGLKEHYAKTTVEAETNGKIATIKTSNVTILGIDRDAAEQVQFGEQILPLRTAVKGLLPMVYFRLTETGWETFDYDQSIALLLNKAARKRPHLQGPIDDAFTGPFLCVVGTGKPWNEKVDEVAKIRLEQFKAEWSEFLRGDLPVKDDSAVTAEDVETRHLILFGDSGSNRIMARVLPDLPISWTKNEIKIAGKSYAANEHIPSLIAASPVNSVKYVVLNSGHTFGTKDFMGTNALLYPRLGDWGVSTIDDVVVSSGFFDERWK